MRIEMLATGDELVTGRLADTNSQRLGGMLFNLGESLRRTTVVGDRMEEIVAALRESAARADVVVVSGGLGPTLDDLSVDAACEAFGRTPVLDEAQLERIRGRFQKLGRAFTPNNERQARVPGESEILGNDWGTATAFVVHAGRQDGGVAEVWFVPGVPKELMGILTTHLLPRLRRRVETEGVYHAHREVKCLGIPESHLDEAVRPLLGAHPHVRYGTRVHFPEAHARLVASGSSQVEAESRCDAIERAVRSAIGRPVFGGEEDTLPSVTVEALRARSWRVCFAESLTAGLAAATLAEAPGASDVLLGSFVTYASDLKGKWLGVSPSVLEAEGAVSEACARAMAEGALERSGADLAVALTGYAGPEGGKDGTPVGTFFAAIAG
ncbi:MAG TPA: CinA family nicotinamide mononucleotide deamidase-related protein, partial [Vulgatibacter sp.]